MDALAADPERPAGRDLADRRDIETLIYAFYGRAFCDPLLGPVFLDIAHLDLDTNLTSHHFRRWVDLWMATTDELLGGPRAEAPKIQAGRIAWAFSRRLLGVTDDALLAM